MYSRIKFVGFGKGDIINLPRPIHIPRSTLNLLMTLFFIGYPLCTPSYLQVSVTRLKPIHSHEILSPL